MAIVRLDKVQSAYDGNLENIQYSSDISNGTLWVLGTLVDGNREVSNISPVDKTNAVGFDPIVLHASTEYYYDPILGVDLSTFKLKAGKIGRAYHLTVGDVITITNDLLDNVGGNVLNVGDLVGPSPASAGLYQKADAQGKVKASAGDASPVEPKLLFRCIEVTTLSGNTAYALRVVKNHK